MPRFRHTFAMVSLATTAALSLYRGNAWAQDAAPRSQSPAMPAAMPDMPDVPALAPSARPMQNAPVMPGTAKMDMSMMNMQSSVDLLSPMSQEASGTAWLPSTTPMYGKMLMRPNGDSLMLHGAIMPRYVDTGSQRGDRRVDAPNWFMAMYGHPLGANDQLGLRAMLSLDPITEGGRGYPLLFQTGESWHGQPLHDHQHPHDLFSELSVDFSHKLTDNASTYLYLGYPGEPALGPPTYMHRLIAYDLADAPIGHHWQDSTHIQFGVATVGLNLGNRVKIEGSVFTGLEPDENRYNFERPRLDSQSGRLSFSPDARNAFQVSYGSIKNPEGDGIGQHRLTGSWIYELPMGEDANFTTTLSYGQIIEPGGVGRSNSVLAEADYNFGRDALFTRIERIQKSGNELSLPSPFATDDLYALGAYTFGYLHDLSHGKGIDTGIGGAITLDSKPSSLNPTYGGQSAPIGFQVMLRFRPSRTKMDNMSGMRNMGSMSNMPGMKDMDGISGMAGMNGTTGDAAPASKTEGEGTVTATLAPVAPVAGQANRLTVTVHDAQGAPLVGATVTLTSNMTTMDMGTTKRTLTDAGDGAYTTDLTFGMAGTWRVTVTVTPPNGGAKIVRTFDFAATRKE